MTTEQEIRNKVKVFRPTSQEVNLFDPNINDKSTRLYKFKDNNDNRFKIWVFTDTIKLETPLTTSIFFSINIPDKVCLSNKFSEEISGIGKVFTDNSKDNQIQTCIRLLKDDLKSFNFDNSEGLTVYRNSLQLTLKNERQILPEIEVCKRIKSTIELNYPYKIYDIDYSDLPVNLRQTIAEFDSWAISDDFKREEKIKEATNKEINDLILKIKPKLEHIKLFLDSFNDKPLTEGGIKLQNLWELVIELTLDKEKKNHS